MTIAQSQAIKEVSADTMLRICELPAFIQNDEQSPQDLIRSFARWAAGDLNWAGVVRETLSSDPMAAFELAASGPIEEIDAEVGAELEKAYGELSNKIATVREEIQALLASLPPEASLAQREAEKLRAAVQEANLPGAWPRSASQVELIRGTRYALEDALGEARDLVEFGLLEVTDALAELFDAADRAWSRLTGLARDISGRLPERETVLLTAIPRLLVERRLDELRRIADPKTNLAAIELSAEWQAGPTRRQRRRVGARFETGGQVKRYRLSSYAEAYWREVEADATTVGSVRELDSALELVAAKSLGRERARVLLALAKSASDPQLRDALLGAGLLEHGEADLTENKIRHARLLLVDALMALAASNTPQARELVPRAVSVIVVAWCWPALYASESGTGSLKAWVDDPSLAYQHLAQSGRLGLIGNIWAAHIDDDVAAEFFLEQASAAIGDDLTLFRHCAREVLKVSFIRRHPLLSARRLRRLLADVAESGQVKELIERAANEIASIDERAPAVRRTLQEIAGRLDERLSILAQQGSSLAPLHEFAERLPQVLRTIVERPIEGQGEPSLRVRSLAPELFLREQPAEIALPVAVINDASASTARSVTALLVLTDGGVRPDIVVQSISLEDIDPGEEREIHFILETPRNWVSRASTLNYRVELDVNGRREAHALKAEIRPDAQRRNRSDPYVAGPALREDDIFVGRERELEELRSSLVGDAPKRAILVHGIRRIGKTSLLHRIGRDREIRRRYGVCYWDVEDRTQSDTNGDVLCDLAEKIRDTLPGTVQSQVYLRRQELRGDPLRAFEKFVVSVDAVESRYRILLLIDEFDRLSYLAQSNECRGVTPEIMAAIRKGIMSSSFLHIVFCGLPGLRRQEYTDRLFGLMHPVPVRPLQRAEVDEIIDRASSLMVPTARARQLIHRLTGRQPYLVQSMCSFLFHRMKREGRGIVTCEDVEGVISERMSTNEYTQDYARLIEEGDREVLRGLALAHKEAPNREFVSVNEVVQALGSDGIEIASEDVLSTLAGLSVRGEADEVERPLVVRAPNSRERFQLVIGLLGRSLVGNYV